MRKFNIYTGEDQFVATLTLDRVSTIRFVEDDEVASYSLNGVIEDWSCFEAGRALESGALIESACDWGLLPGDPSDYFGEEANA